MDSKIRKSLQRLEKEKTENVTPMMPNHILLGFTDEKYF
jgi:hypothetical protein